MKNSGAIRITLVSLSFIGVTALSGCMEAYRKSVVGQAPQVFSQILLTDADTAWAATKEALKSVRIDVDNKEGGIVQTKWTDNTNDRNFTDSFGGADVYLQAQYRFKISLAPGAYDGKPSIKINVQKDQLVKKDVLEGWKPVESDGTEEKTLLYRIGRLAFMRMKLAQQEEARKKRELEETHF